MFKSNAVDNILMAIVLCFFVWGGFFIYSANEEKEKAIKQMNITQAKLDKEIAKRADIEKVLEETNKRFYELMAIASKDFEEKQRLLNILQDACSTNHYTSESCKKAIDKEFASNH